ncbi:MAG: 4-hydroxythreonine-4-phosphate dehydrogenase PdxA [Balneola sp.]
MKPKIGITIGDINGIGPEIAVKALSSLDLAKSTPFLISPVSVVDYYKQIIPNSFSYTLLDQIEESSYDGVYVLDNSSSNPEPTLGSISKESGSVAMKSIESAIDLCMSKKIDAMVTLPISKEAVNLGGYKIPGHTEFLAEKTDTDLVLMMLVNAGLRVALTTVHIPISEVSSAITKKLIVDKASILNESLKNDFGIAKPKVAVLGLNPHAGDGGIIGKEEINTITPAISTLQEQGIDLEGPFPADGFFGQKRHLKYDAILAMYHDQGLAPFKLISFGKGVNFTAGLPIIRTSPDHGTAFDIAGKGVADPSSFIQAYNLAVELANLRQ